MKHFISVLALTGAGVLVVLSGCAEKAITEHFIQDKETYLVQTGVKTVPGELDLHATVEACEQNDDAAACLLAAKAFDTGAWFDTSKPPAPQRKFKDGRPPRQPGEEDGEGPHGPGPEDGGPGFGPKDPKDGERGPGDAPAPEKKEMGKKHVRQNAALALVFYANACERGSAESCTELGSKYMLGMGAGEDLLKAADYFEKGCGMRDASACVLQGKLYEIGRGSIASDYEKAHEAYQKACKLNNDTGCKYDNNLEIVENALKSKIGESTP